MVWYDGFTGTADILNSTAEDGEVRLTLGDSRTDGGISHGSPAWGIDGFVSRPAEPDDDGSARAFYMLDGNDKVVLSTCDMRNTTRAGEVGPGDRAIITKGEARVLVKNESDSATMLSTNRSSGESMLVSVNGETGIIHIMNGGSFIEIHKDQIVLSVNGGGSLVIDSDGVTVGGKKFNAATISGRLGIGPNPLIPPLQTDAALRGISGPAGAPSANWFISQ